MLRFVLGITETALFDTISAPPHPWPLSRGRGESVSLHLQQLDHASPQHVRNHRFLGAEPHDAPAKRLDLALAERVAHGDVGALRKP